jgi:biofilm PGA synthesis N-glycosyltransferase PgaC
VCQVDSVQASGVGSTQALGNYVLITPARNEADNIPRLAECVLGQTYSPDRWVIVDDASTDDSRALALELADAVPWIRVVDSPGSQVRAGRLNQGRRGGRDMIAFNTGLRAIDCACDFVVKVDADVSFEPDFFKRLLGEFATDPTLGIASGTCHELVKGQWRPYHVARSHVRGATRTYRRACFEDVAPLAERIGWDGVDEARAHLHGWRTGCIPTLPFYHHRALGARDGGRRAWAAQGDLAWYLGYRPSYVVLRALFRSLREPQAVAMITAYLYAAVGRAERAEQEVRTHTKGQQRLRDLRLRAREASGRA